MKRHEWIIVLLVIPMAVWPAMVNAQEHMGQGQSLSRGSYGSGLAEDVLIQTDPETGSLIIITDEETNRHIGEIIKSLDRPIPQVLIKVLFLEVTHGKGLDLGVEASYTVNESENRDIIETIFGVASQTEGGFYRVIEEDLLATIRAIADVNKLEVLSRPSILARHNKEAVITVGQEVPFIRNSRITQDGQTINTVEYEDIGIILRVTPYITTKGFVEMDLLPEISTLTGDTVPISDTIDAPVFAKRSAETRVVVPDGKTVVIGGLMQDNKTETVSKVPLLGDIPLLGMAFRRTQNEDSKTELLIFLTPNIVETSKQLEEVSEAEKGKMELAPKVFDEQRMSKYLDTVEE